MQGHGLLPAGPRNRTILSVATNRKGSAVCRAVTQGNARSCAAACAKRPQMRPSMQRRLTEADFEAAEQVAQRQGISFANLYRIIDSYVSGHDDPLDEIVGVGLEADACALHDASLYMKYSMAPETLPQLVSGLKSLVVEVLEWEAEGRVLEDGMADDDRVNAPFWWTQQDERPDTTHARAMLARSDPSAPEPNGRSFATGPGTPWPDIAASSLPDSSEAETPLDPRGRNADTHEVETNRARACWRWWTDGATSLREVRDELREAAAYTAQLIREGWLIDGDMMGLIGGHGSLEIRRIGDPVSSGEDSDWNDGSGEEGSDLEETDTDDSADAADARDSKAFAQSAGKPGDSAKSYKVVFQRCTGNPDYGTGVLVPCDADDGGVEGS